eukprot:TRINITY_DN195_c0_g2_i1.p1 TRINITY_DN195_c0_g2~~TRINITY_DN195_c0_g2_i1.p1  ORF type:complete len:123 (-),score=13.38 TRINITY_DN195_c0_g2_i1:81-449(-)
MYQFLLLSVLFFVTTQAGVCDYCKYCDYCGYCVDCPCENDRHNTQCDLCVYCKYCTVCSACNSLCSDDSWIQRTWQSLFGTTPASTEQLPSGVPTPKDIEVMLAKRKLDLSTVPKRRDSDDL